jgi:hypothetical protein
VGLARLHGPGNVDIVGRCGAEFAHAGDIDGPSKKKKTNTKVYSFWLLISIKRPGNKFLHKKGKM